MQDHSTSKPARTPAATTRSVNTASLQNFDLLPDSAFCRLPTVCALLASGPASIWRWSKDGKIPAPRKISSRVTVWSVGELREFMRRTV